MRVWKIINVDRDYGTTRIIILSLIVGILAFCLCYVLVGLQRTSTYLDDYLSFFIAGIFFIYPLHKFIHYLLLIDYTHSMKLKIRYKFNFYPLIHIKIYKLVPKYRYLLSLAAPFILLNSIFLLMTFYFPAFAHYFSIYLGIHCAMCLIDLLNVKYIIRAPHRACIEETPKGYEVLVPFQ